MSRISSILGYTLVAIMLLYFSVNWFIEDQIARALSRISAWSDSIEGVSFKDVDFYLFSGDIELESLEIERMDPFRAVHADKATFEISWKDRFKFLLERDFSPLRLQGLEIELEGLRMVEKNAAVWTAGFTRLNFSGDLEEAVLSFLKQKATRRSFKTVLEIERANINPPPELTVLLPVSGFVFPVQNLKMETAYDPGIYTLRSDIYMSKQDTSSNHIAVTVVFDNRKREALVPKKAVVDLTSQILSRGRRFMLNEEGNELAIERIDVSGTLEFVYSATTTPAWIPDRARARVGLKSPTIYPSTKIMRQYGPFFQAFGFENGFAELDSVGGSIRFESGLFRIERTRAYADWMEAEINMQSSLFENSGFDAPIQTGSIRFVKLSGPITAGIKFVERQFQKPLFSKDGSLKLELGGTLNAPKIKGVF